MQRVSKKRPTVLVLLKTLLCDVLIDNWRIKMARVQRNTEAKLVLVCDDENDKFVAHYTNMGEPFRQGINIGVANNDYDKEVTVMLEDYEAKQLRDLLLKHYPLDT